MKRPLIIGLIVIAVLFILVRYRTQGPPPADASGATYPGLIASLSRFFMGPQDNSAHRNPNPHERLQMERSQTMLEDEEYTLLAIKHGIRAETVKNILADYDSAFWGITDLLEPEKAPQLIFPEATNTSEVVTAISKKYDVPSPAVASLLIDRKLMQERSDE